MTAIRGIDARLKKLETRKGAFPADLRIGIIKGPIDLDVETFELGARSGDYILTTTFEWDSPTPEVVSPVRAESEMEEDLRAYLDRLTDEVVRLGDKQDIAGARTF